MSVHQLCGAGDLDAVKELIIAGVSVNTLDNEARTPLHYAILSKNRKLMNYLVRESADVSLVDKNGYVSFLQPNVRESDKEYVLERLNKTPTHVPDDTHRNCMLCKNDFSFIIRRHHCRHCGLLVCAECSFYRVSLPSFSHLSPVRVCTQCYPIIQKTRKQYGYFDDAEDSEISAGI